MAKRREAGSGGEAEGDHTGYQKSQLLLLFIVGAIGLGLLLLIAVIELRSHHVNDVHGLAATLRASDINDADYRAIVEELESRTRSLADLATVLTFLREVAFAFIIAAVIGYVIERIARQEQIDLVDRFRKTIANDAIGGALGMFLPSTFRDAFRAVMSQHNIIRNNISMIYELHEIPDDAIMGDAAYKAAFKQQFVQLRVVINYVIVNISGTPTSYEIKNGFAVRPEVPAYEEYTGIQTWKVNGEKISLDECAESDDGDSAVLYTHKLVLPPGKKIAVQTENRLLKERSDNEIWASQIPTEEAIIGFASYLTDPVKVGISSNFGGKMADASEDGFLKAHAWKSSGPILPNQTIIVWWREPPKLPPIGSPGPPPQATAAK